MNILSKLLDKATGQRKIGYHPKCKNQKLTHLCFADDIMVFSDGKFRSIEGILSIFYSFGRMSGMKISVEKSMLFVGGISDVVRCEIQDRFPSMIGNFPMRYLGLPLLTKRMSKLDYAPLIESIRSRITSWTSRFLSFAGRVQLITSVLASIMNFWSSAFRLPKACIKEIDSLCSAFLWSGPELNCRKAKVAWKDVCKPKEEGGLGIRSLQETNLVCCLKLIWRLVSTNNLLWANWIKQHIIRKASFWATNSNQQGGSGSWMWRKMIKYKELPLPFGMILGQS